MGSADLTGRTVVGTAPVDMAVDKAFEGDMPGIDPFDRTVGDVVPADMVTG